MTENHSPHGAGARGHRHDYLPAAGHDAFLPGYDLLTRVLGFDRAYRALIEQADLANAQSVLEVGCGTGNLITQVPRRHPGVTAVGCDPDPRALARAERKARGLRGISFQRGYAQKLPFEDAEFDRVLSSMMWHHLPEEVKADAAAEFFRVLRPGGSLHLVDMAGDLSPDDGIFTRRLLRSPHAAGNVGDAIPRRLQSAGFDCTVVGTQRVRLIGRVTFFRAVRPA